MFSRALWLCPAVAIFFVSSPLQAVPVHQWSHRFGDSWEQNGYSAAIDASGNVYITGRLSGTTDFGGGPLTSLGYDVFIAKFDANGKHIWSKRFGDGDNQVGLSIAVDGSGKVAITGEFSGTVDFGGGPFTYTGYTDAFVAKFDTNGNHLWSKQLGAYYSDSGTMVATDALGNVVVTGYVNGTVDLGGGPVTSAYQDIFVVKFRASGTYLWSHLFGDIDEQWGYSVAVDGSRNVVLAGIFEGSVDFGGGPLEAVDKLIQSGGVQGDLYLAKLDSGGEHLWSERFGDDADFFALPFQLGSSIAVDGSNDIFLTANFGGTVDIAGLLTSTGGQDILLAKFWGQNGDPFWGKRFGNDMHAQQGNSVATDGSDNVVLSGWIGGAVDFGGGPLSDAGSNSIFVAQFDPNGNHLWSQGFEASFLPEQQGYSVAANDVGDVVITGGFQSVTDFGGGWLTSAGGFDIFLAKFAVPPLPVLITRFDATPRNGTVEVTWDVWSDEDLESYTIYRRDESQPQAVAIARDLFGATTRSYIDPSVASGRTYHYELVIRTLAGDDVRSPVATVTVPSLRTALGQNFPNPFRPATSIEYTLGERSSAVVGIYDATGRLVARLDEGVREAGTHRAEWDGRDVGGRVVGSGVYFYRLEGVPSLAPRKMVRLK